MESLAALMAVLVVFLLVLELEGGQQERWLSQAGPVVVVARMVSETVACLLLLMVPSRALAVRVQVLPWGGKWHLAVSDLTVCCQAIAMAGAAVTAAPQARWLELAFAASAMCSVAVLAALMVQGFLGRLGAAL